MISRPARKPGRFASVHPATWPVVTATGAAIVTGYVAGVSPLTPGHYPVCPLYALTGYYCPGCGTLRAIHELARGHLAQAAGYNVLTVAMLPVLAYFWLAWLTRSLRRQPRRSLAHPAWIWGFAAAVVVFWVFRNVPPGHFLAPGGIS
jgi:hypothetical protein